MAHVQLETAQAKYLLLLENHVRATNHTLIAGLGQQVDAFVLEHTQLADTALGQAQQALKSAINAGNVEARVARARGWDDQLGELGRLIEGQARARRRPVPSYILDVDLTPTGLYGSWATSVGVATLGAVLVSRANRRVRRAQIEARKFSRRELLGCLAELAGGSWLLADLVASPLPALFAGELREPWLTLLSTRMQMTPTPLVELRNALLARKLEEHVVPALVSGLGRKPLVVIFYGGRHVSIEAYLRSPARRDAVLGLWRAGGHAGAIPAHLDRCMVLTCSPDASWALEDLKLRELGRPSPVPDPGRE